MANAAAVAPGRPVARKLQAQKMVSKDTPAWWAAALPTAPTFTAAGNPQWWVTALPLARCEATLAARFTSPRHYSPLFLVPALHTRT